MILFLRIRRAVSLLALIPPQFPADGGGAPPQLCGNSPYTFPFYLFFPYTFPFFYAKMLVVLIEERLLMVGSQLPFYWLFLFESLFFFTVALAL